MKLTVHSLLAFLFTTLALADKVPFERLNKDDAVSILSYTL